MGGISIKVDIRENASPTVLRLSQAMKRGDVRKVMGRAIANTLRAYFVELDGTRPNKLGGTRTHFWADVRRSVQQPELVGGDGVKVAINHVGFAQRLFGGTIVPRNKKWLTIAARAEAYGKRAGEFNDLHFVFFHPGLAALVQNEQIVLGRRRKDGLRSAETAGGGVFFWLRKEVNQKPDPTALPPESKLADAAVKAGSEYLDTLAQRDASAN